MAADRVRMTKFLVLLEDTRESVVAIRFAAQRAARIHAGVTVLAVIRAEDIAHGIGVAEVMRAEAREQIEVQFEAYAKWMRERVNVTAELVIREGDAATELLSILAEDPQISIVVMGVAGEAGPVAKRLMRDAGALPCALTFVPSALSSDRLDAIS